MLRSLLLREWLLNRNHLFVIMGMVLAFETYFAIQTESTRFWLVASAAYVAFLTFVPFSREDKFRSGASTCTLPVTRREIVLSRWLGAWVMVVAALILIGALATALPWSRVSLAAMFEPQTLVLAGTLVTLILILMLPFTIRFGLLGLMIFMVAAQVLGAGAFLAAIFFSRAGDSSRRPVKEIFDSIEWGLVAFHESLSSPQVCVLVIVALVALNWAGYRFALAMYRRREF